MKKIFYLIILVLTFCPVLASAGEVFWQTVEGAPNKVAIIFDTTNDKINTIEGEISFDANAWELKNISDANSLVNFWVERPAVSKDKIIFSGITPGGYQGKGLVLTLEFASKNGTSELGQIIQLDKFNALLSDGKGTPAVVKKRGFVSEKFNLNQTDTNSKIADFTPEVFQPEVARDANLPTGDYYLIFNTQDKYSGLDYYAVYESRWPVWNAKKSDAKITWVKTNSPYLLQDQKLWSFIYVKAVNHAGGVTIARVSPQYLTNRLYQWLVILVIIIGTLWFLKRKLFGGGL